MLIIRSPIFNIILVLLVSFFVTRGIVQGVTVSTSTNIYITAEVGGGGTTPPVPGGGGGSSSGTPGLQTTVNFSGMGYPLSKIVILQDGRTVVNTIADPNANFSASVLGLTQGTYTFSLYAQDSKGKNSTIFSFPVYVTSGTIINIGGIILAPTIDVQNSEVRRGDNQPIFGFTTPNSQVNIAVHSGSEHFVTTTSGISGAYLYNFDTTPLEYGNHDAQSRSLLKDKVSAQTDPVPFIVSTQNKPKPAGCSALIGDINCDGKVNLVDFSILAYWYKKGSVPPANVDLNADGKITLVDFSILAYHWTG
ncbi:MAG: dockerin type I repeat-containing protein [Patescibacteria group bacterium]